MKNLLIIASTVLALCSCSKGGDYVDAIPSTATALVAIDGSTPLLSDVEGIDNSKTIYLFELAGGDMGLCALGTDGDPLITFLPESTMNAQEHQEKLLDHMKECDPENSIRKSQLWQHLNEMQASSSKVQGASNTCNMYMVAQTNVLPKQMQACLLLGAPRGTDPADVLLEGTLDYDNSENAADGKGVLILNGHTCSYNEMVKQNIGSAFQVFQPITFDWGKSMQPNSLLGIFMNIDGTQFMPLLQSNKTLNMMLMGSNAYERIKESHGNMAIIGTIDNKWSVETSINKTESYSKKEKLVVCINMQSLPKEFVAALGFLTGKINKIVYKVE